jgi:hypothetical protein
MALMSNIWKKLTPGDHGFAWGPVLVERVAEIRGTGVIRLTTETGAQLQIYVSRTGKSIRAFKDGKELR